MSAALLAGVGSAGAVDTVVSADFGTGGVNTIPGTITLDGSTSDRFTINTSIDPTGAGLASAPTAGLFGTWITTGNTGINDTFASPWFTVPIAATRTDAIISNANLAGIDPVTGLPGAIGGNTTVPQGVGISAGTAFVDRYAVLYNGLFNTSATGGAGSYVFNLPSDDGSSLFIDGRQVVANEGPHGLPGGGATGIAVALTAGLHQITIKNSNGGTGGGLTLNYSLNGGAQAVVPAAALSNVAGGLSHALKDALLNDVNVVVNNAGNSVLETTGFDTTSAGTITVNAGANLNFASATSHSFTQNGTVSLNAGSGLSSSGVVVTVPQASTLTPAKTTINGAVTLLGDANLNADGARFAGPGGQLGPQSVVTGGLLTINGVIDDLGVGYGITKNNGGGTVVLGGTTANTFSGVFNAAQGVLVLNKPAGVNAIGFGGLNLDTGIAPATAAIDYAVVRLQASEQIQNGTTVNVLMHNTGNNGATLDLNNFTETIGTLNVRGAGTSMGRVVTGATGTLAVNGDITLTNNTVGGTGREALITGVASTSNALNLFQPGTGTLNLSGSPINVAALTGVASANTDGTIDSIITNGGITKIGGQRLVLNGSNPNIGRNSTFGLGVILSDGVLRGGGMGAQTSSVFGTGPLTINKGLTTADGGIAAGGATLELRNNTAGVNYAVGGTVGANFVGQSVNNVVNYGNAVNVDAGVPVFGVDVNNYSQIVTNAAGATLATLNGSGGELRMGTLSTLGTLQLNVTGGNNYSLAFNGISLGGTLSVNATTGNLRLNNLSGGNGITTLATNTGNVIIGGTAAGFTGNVNVSAGGTLRLAPKVGVANDLFNLGGGGSFTTAANPTIGISPTIEGGALVAGTPGGLTARFYQVNNVAAPGLVLNNTVAFASIPSGVTTVGLLSDAAIVNRPPTVTASQFQGGVVVYSGLLDIAAGGSYAFQTFVDDESQLVIDGLPVISVNTGGGGTGDIHSPVSAPLNLSAGLHTISMKVLNNGGGGGVGVSYQRTDIVGDAMRPIPSTALQSVAALTNVANSGVNQSIAAAGSLTLDGGGTDLDGGINDLTFAGAGTLTVTNAGGIGAITVSGVTSVGANTATLNPITGILGLIGDVTGNGTINKTSAGTLIFAGPKNFNGPININAGGVQVTNAASLGTVAFGTTVASGAVLDINGTALGAEPLSLNGAGIAQIAPAALYNSASGAASASGPITLTGATTVGGLGDMSLTGAITGAFNVIKIGPNTLTVTNANNTGTITVNTGFLKLGGAGAIGANVTNVLMLGGGVLDLAGQSMTRPINLIGAGTTNYGAMNSLGSLINTGASGVTVSGNIVLGGAASLGSSSLGAGGGYTISGIISAAQALTKVGGNAVTLTGVNTYTGATTVNLGILNINGGGTINTSASLTVNPTALVNFDYSTATTLKLGAAHGINLVGGSLNMFGNAANVVETLTTGVLTSTSNNSVWTLTPAAGTLQLTSTVAAARGSNGTALFRGTNLGVNTTVSLTGGAASIAPLSIPTIGQAGGVGATNRAVAPWALVDTSATGVGTSFAAFVAANGIQVLGAADYAPANTIPAMTGIVQNGSATVANLLLNGGATTAALAALPGGIGNMSNSLTMDANANLTIGAGTSVLLDSGGILVRSGTVSTISGPGTINALQLPAANFVFNPSNGPQGVTAREIIIQTPGTAVLNINAPIGNANPLLDTANLTKAGAGDLSLGAQNFFVGSVRINGGRVLLASGAENTLVFPITTPPVKGALPSTLNANLGNIVGNAGILDLRGQDQRVGGLGSNLAAGSSALPGTGGVITNTVGGPAATLRVSQGATFAISTAIQGNLNFQRDGGFTITMTSPNTYTGTTVLNGGLTVLQDGATLSGTSSITINRAALRIDDTQTIQTLNRIPAATPITLNGGSLAFVGRGGGTQNVHNIGPVTIGLGSALFQGDMPANTNANSAGDLRVNISNLTRGGVGSQVFFDFVQRGNQNMGDNPRFYLAQLNGGALPAPGTMLPAWITVGGYNPASAAGGTSGSVNNITNNTSDFAQYDQATGVRPVLYTSTFAPGNNVNIGSTTTIPVGGAVVNSLRLEGASTLIFGDAGYDTLNLQSGGLMVAFNANLNAKTIGLVSNAGNITAGGVNPGGPRELYIYSSGQPLTLNARIIDNPTDGSSISPVFSSHSLGGTVTIQGSNTYTGTTYVNGLNVTLNNTVGGLAIPGNLVISGGTSNGGDSQAPGSQTVTLSASNQIAPTATVTLNGGTLLNLGVNSQTLANLVFAADGGSNSNQGSAVQTGTGVVTLTGGLTATILNQATTIPSINGNLNLPAGPHTFNIGTFAGAPGQVGFALNTDTTGSGGINKIGPGILGIDGNSPAYTGTYTVTSGSIQFLQNAATAIFRNDLLTNGAVNLGAAGILNAGGFNGTVGTLTGTGTVTSNVGPFTVTSQIINGITVVPQVNVGVDGGAGAFNGLITSSLIFGKAGVGNQTITNPANDYTGGTRINGGTFTLGGGAGVNVTGPGLVAVNNTGSLAGVGAVTGGLQFNHGSGAAFNLGAPAGPAPITTPASVVSTGMTTFNITGTTGVGTYPLIDYAGAAITAGQMAGFKLGSTPGGGLLYGLINNAAGTSIDLSVQAVNASQTWTGAASGIWDTAANNWSGTYTANNQAVFTNAGAKKNITGAALTPQAITVANSGVCNDYSIANDIGGALAGGLTKSGNGLLQLTGNNTFTGPITVSGGTVRANVSSAANSLGSGSVTLASGTTLRLDGTANTGTNGLTGRIVTGGLNSAGNTFNNFYGQSSVFTGTFFTAGTTLITGGTNPFYTNGVVNNFGAQFTGKIKIDAAGPYSFTTRSDDGSRLFIDGVLVLNNDGGKGTFGAGNSVMLTNGLHDIRVDFGQGTGGDDLSLYWQGPGIAKAFIPAANLFTAESVTSTGSSSLVNAGTNVSISGSATLNLAGTNFSGVQLGSLTTPAGSTLNVTGDAGRLARASGTFLSGGTATFNTTADLALGQVVDGGVATTLVKQGAGRLFLDNTNFGYTGLASSLVAGTTIEVQAGKVIAQGYVGGASPLSGAQVRLNGGGLVLDSKQGNATFNNALTVSQNALVEVVPAGATQILGSGTNGVTINGGSTLTVDLYGGARTNGSGQAQAIGVQGAALTIAGAITGTGNLAFRSTQFDQGMYPVFGSSTFTANNTFAGTVTLTGGLGAQNVVTTMPLTLNSNGRLAGTTGITLNAAQLTVDDSATINTGRINATTAAPITLRNGNLVIATSTTASSGETIAAITSDVGVNRIVLTNTPGATFTGLLTASSLVRNNRSVVQFVGSSLGGQATAASLVKFTSALTGQLVGGAGAAATSTISILPFGFGASNAAGNPPTYMPVTYDATNGVRPINTTTEITTLAAAVTNANTRDSIGAAAAPVPTANLINSWVLDNSATTAQVATLTTSPLLFNGAGAGLLMLTATNGTQSALTITGTAINFNAAEGNIIVSTTAGATISSVIQGTNGITISGNNNINSNNITGALWGGTLTLTADNSAGLTGAVTINGRLVINNGITDLPLGNAANPVQFGGGTLVFNTAGSTLAATRTVTLLGNSFGVIDTNGNADTIAGPITGSGGLIKINTGRLTLSNSVANNNYSGTTTVLQGDLTTNTGPQGNLIISGAVDNGAPASATVSNVTFSQATGGTYSSGTIGVGPVTLGGNYTGNISGIGSVTINVLGANQIITLGDPNNANVGVNSYAGGTNIASATTSLRGTTSSLVGGIVAPAATNLVIDDQNFNGTASNVISGPATFLKLGTGAVTVVNASSYTGITTISAGSLIAATNAPNAANGAFGNAASAIVLGDAATTANNSSPSLLTGAGATIGRSVLVDNFATTGKYTIGGSANATSTFSGAIAIRQPLEVTQVATGNAADALKITGGIQAGNAGLKTVTFAGPGAMVVSTTGITDGAGSLQVDQTAGTLTISTPSTYSGPTNIGVGGADSVLRVEGTVNDILPVTNVLNVNVDGIGNGTVLIGVSQTLAAVNIGNGGLVVISAVLPEVWAPAPALPPSLPELGEGALGADFVGASAPVQGVPEPGTATLLIGGMLTMLGLRRRRG